MGLDSKVMTRNMLLRYGKVLTDIQVTGTATRIWTIEYAGYTWQLISYRHTEEEIVCLDHVESTKTFIV